MSEQTQVKRPSSGGSGETDTTPFVKVDPASDEAKRLAEKLKKAQAVTPKKPRRACCCC